MKGAGRYGLLKELIKKLSGDDELHVVREV
jgi:hypothetical protein